MYKFRKPTEEEISAMENMWYDKCCRVYEQDSYIEKSALFYGKLRTVFGEPVITSHETMYSYDIVAIDENGNKFYFEIYDDLCYASIGTPYDLSSDCKQAISELIEFIESAEPSDYIWECYNDTPITIISVKDGKAHIESDDMQGFI